MLRLSWLCLAILALAWPAPAHAQDEAAQAAAEEEVASAEAPLLALEDVEALVAPYVINGNMIGGVAVIAYPAAYGNSGLMSFIVNQQGVVHERDLGVDTAVVAQSLTEYDPEGWTESAD